MVQEESLVVLIAIPKLTMYDVITTSYISHPYLSLVNLNLFLFFFSFFFIFSSFFLRVHLLENSYTSTSTNPQRLSSFKMTRGNQREKAREKNNKKKEAEKKKIDGDPKKRMEAHAAIMREKQKAGKIYSVQCVEMFYWLFILAFEKKAATGQ